MTTALIALITSTDEDGTEYRLCIAGYGLTNGVWVPFPADTCQGQWTFGTTNRA